MRWSGRTGSEPLRPQRGEEKYDEAELLHRRALTIYRESLGERHRFTGIAFCALGDVLQRKGDLAASYPHFRECLSILEEVHPENHQELAYNRSRFGAVLLAQAGYEEAEPLLLEAYRALHEQLGPDHTRTRQAAQRLVELYEVWGRPDQAEPYRLRLATAGGTP